MSSDSHSAKEIEVRLRRACAELEQRVREGESNVAQQMLALQPEIACNEDLAIELIYAEFVTLEELGAAPSPHETLTQFPQWRARLERLLKLHDAFRHEAESAMNGASDTLTRLDSTSDGQPERITDSNGVLRQRIGRYELLEEINRGGMGIVYKARQIGLNRIVAIKSIRSADASEAERSRFRLEAESAAKLHHPNMVQVYDVGQHNGVDFISMEFVAGGSLDNRLHNETFSIHATAKLIATVAEAIHFAHQRGIVHRDLKPGNILLDNDVPKIGDFGLAKWMESLDAQTQTGAVLGTPSYMSPEQSEGKLDEIKPPTDIYALGAILYEMLTGQPPFVGETPLETIDLIRHREPDPPSSLAPNLPGDLETICLKCLSKEPTRRYESAQELADDLNRFLDHQPIRARRVGLVERSWRWARRRPAISGLAATLLLVTLVGVIVVAWQQRQVGELSKSADATKKKAEEVEQLAAAATAEAGDNLRAAKQALQRLSLLGATLNDQPGMGTTAQRTVEHAVQQYQELLKKYGDDHAVRWEAARAFERAGYIQLELGQLAEAERSLVQGIEMFETLEKSDKIDYEQAGTIIQLAHCQRKLHKWKQSEASYKSAIAQLESLNRAHPQDNAFQLRLANTLVNLAVVLKHENRYDEAEQAYCQAINLQRRLIERTARIEVTPPEEKRTQSPADKTRHEILASQTLRQRIVERGEGTLAPLIRWRYLPELALSLDDLGRLLLQEDSLELAELAIHESLILRQLVEQHAQAEDRERLFLARSHSSVGRLETQQGDYEQAAAAFEEAVFILENLTEEFPHRVPYKSGLGDAYSDLARAMQNCNRFDDALVYHHKAIALHQRLTRDDPTLQTLKNDFARSLFDMGLTLRDTNKSAQSLRCFRYSLHLNPKSDAAANVLAWIFLMDTDRSIRDPQEALPLAKRAVDLEPAFGNYWNTLGIAHYRNGNDAQAIEALTHSMRLRDGGDGYDWFFLAMTHARQGDEERATQWYQRAQTWFMNQKSPNDELLQTQVEAAKVFGR